MQAKVERLDPIAPRDMVSKYGTECSTVQQARVPYVLHSSIRQRNNKNNLAVWTRGHWAKDLHELQVS
jgi:hypothetical protein